MQQALLRASTNVAPDGKKILLNLVSQPVIPSVPVMTNFTAAFKK
jgi:hypothetical protein